MFLPLGQLGVIVKINEGFYKGYYEHGIANNGSILVIPPLLNIAIALLFFGSITVCTILPFFRNIMSKKLRYTIAIICCAITLLILFVVPKFFGSLIWER